ncbi:SRPBCC family protein [Actinoplanes xinjiangensis]|uniref:Polyketide cyclase/dehydrase/lipid transport protein n=1 Tax=Actinoplanes xinjiangensis TaxID=512350 RepID=A0A316FV26_9ACTN|nr:SRPBCC family protein [Actinoplanes xinjiangensis]PWK52283.1 polyketide cyclase/dehydrase/lipid transport protein [Actinoplanes xinjiangensis]GIF37016.1 polyketide cyclase [Actinoplanes xinjiangensis]
MTSASRYLSEHIDVPADEVYAFTADPANLPAWAPGLATSVAREDGRWLIGDDGAELIFTPRNELGVLDHWVRPPDGDEVYAPMRVIPDGEGAEIMFTLRRLPGMTDEDFDRDAGLVQADLTRLKQVLESAR